MVTATHSHLFWLFSGVWWCLETFSWSPDETVCILWMEIQREYITNTLSKIMIVECICAGLRPLAWSLSSWLAVFFHSSILSWSGITRPSIKALQRQRKWWDSEVWGRRPAEIINFNDTNAWDKYLLFLIVRVWVWSIYSITYFTVNLGNVHNSFFFFFSHISGEHYLNQKVLQTII